MPHSLLHGGSEAVSPTPCNFTSNESRQSPQTRPTPTIPSTSVTRISWRTYANIISIDHLQWGQKNQAERFPEWKKWSYLKVFIIERLQSAVLESSGSLNEALCESNRQTEEGLFLLVNERLRMRLPSFNRPTEDPTTNLKPRARKKKKLWWSDLALERTADQDHYTVWLETQEWTWHYIENTGVK